MYQFLQVVYTDITSTRRTVIKGDIQPKYKGLCDGTVPVTDFLFGNDIKEKLKEFDAESEMAQKITGKQMKIRHGRGKKRKHDQDKHEEKDVASFFEGIETINLMTRPLGNMGMVIFLMQDKRFKKKRKQNQTLNQN